MKRKHLSVIRGGSGPSLTLTVSLPSVSQPEKEGVHLHHPDCLSAMKVGWQLCIAGRPMRTDPALPPTALQCLIPLRDYWVLVVSTELSVFHLFFIEV